MLNHVPFPLNRKLTSPFELVHSTKPDPRTWFKLFSLGLFRHQVDDTVSHFKNTISNHVSHCGPEVSFF